MADNTFNLLNMIMLWSNNSMCENCEYKDNKNDCNIEICKKKIKEILDNKNDSDKT